MLWSMSEFEGTTLPYDMPTCDNWNALASFYHPLMAGSIDGTDVVAHDRAVVRAIRSSYKPNKKVRREPYTETLLDVLNWFSDCCEFLLTVR